MQRLRVVALVVRACVTGVAVVAASLAVVRAGQLPLDPFRETGQSVTPAYEGWYPNPDGTFSLSFGYFNRNSTEVVDVPMCIRTTSPRSCRRARSSR